MKTQEFLLSPGIGFSYADRSVSVLNTWRKTACAGHSFRKYLINVYDQETSSYWHWHKSIYFGILCVCWYCTESKSAAVEKTVSSVCVCVCACLCVDNSGTGPCGEDSDADKAYTPRPFSQNLRHALGLRLQVQHSAEGVCFAYMTGWYCRSDTSLHWVHVKHVNGLDNRKSWNGDQDDGEGSFESCVIGFSWSVCFYRTSLWFWNIADTLRSVQGCPILSTEGRCGCRSLDLIMQEPHLM